MPHAAASRAVAERQARGCAVPARAATARNSSMVQRSSASLGLRVLRAMPTRARAAPGSRARPAPTSRRSRSGSARSRETRRAAACAYLGSWRNQTSGVMRTQPGDTRSVSSLVDRRPSRGMGRCQVMDRAPISPARGLAQRRAPPVIVSSPASAIRLRPSSSRAANCASLCGSGPVAEHRRRHRAVRDLVEGIAAETRQQPASSVSSRSRSRIASHQRVLLRQRECREPRVSPCHV